MAVATARSYMADQDAMRAITAAARGLADDPYPTEAFDRGEYHRLRVGGYRVTYLVADDVITVQL